MITPEIAIKKIQQLPPEQLNQLMQFIDFLEFQAKNPNNTIEQPKIDNPPISFTQVAQEFIGCLDSDINDLSHNPKYLEGFGK